MAEKITITSWNAADAFSDTNRSIDAAKLLVGVNADIAIVSEGLQEVPDDKVAPDFLLGDRVSSIFHEAGMRPYVQNYNDTDGRKDRHAMLTVVRETFGSLVPRSEGGREVYFDNLPFTLVGFHGYDRDQNDVLRSDEKRRDQVSKLLASAAHKAIIMGDFNSIHPNSFTAGFLRKMEVAARHLPAKNPGEDCSKLERLGSVTQRLAQMAIGGPVQDLEAAGFVDADWCHAATFSKLGISVQLDHIFSRGLEVSHFTRHSVGDISDHMLISAKVAV